MMRNNRKLCLVVTDVISFNVLCRGQLEYFRDNGIDLDLICGGNDSGLVTLRERGVGRVHKSAMVREPSLLRDLFSLIEIILLLLRIKPSTIVYSTPKAMLLAGIGAFFARVPCRIALVRGRVYENKRGVARKFYMCLDWLTFRLSTKVIAISPSLQEGLISDRLVGAEKLMVLGQGSSNGVDSNRFDPKKYSKIELKSRFGLKDRFVFLSVGRICKEKGAEDVLEAFLSMKGSGSIPNATLIFVGTSEDDNLLSKIHDSRAMDVIHYSSTRNPEEFFAIADVHLFLTHREGFGNVAIEAAAMGVPTIAYNVVGVRDSVKDGVTGYLVPFGNSESVKVKMEWLYANRLVCSEAIGSAARKYVVEHYEQNRVWNLYLNEFLS